MRMYIYIIIYIYLELYTPKGCIQYTYVHRFQTDPIKQLHIFSSKNVKKCKPKKQPGKKTNQQAKKKKQKKCKKKQKKQKKKAKKKQKTKAKAKGTYKKKNFKSQSVFGCKSKCLASCKQIFKLPAASKKNMEQKTHSFYSNNDKIKIRKHHVLQNCHCKQW